MTIEPKPDDASPPAEAPRNRFYCLGSTWVDLAAVVAVGVEGDGYTLHLLGGQAIALPAAAAETAGVLNRLGLPVKRRRRQGKKRPVAAAALAAIAGFFTGQ